MIFPQDVQKSSNEASRLVGRERTRFIVGLILVANGMVAMITVPFFTSLGIWWGIPILAQIIIFLFSSVMYYKIFIFKEDEKIEEYENKMNDSFARYYYLRNMDSEQTIKINEEEIPIYEFDNGSVKTVIRIRFGSNDNTRSKNNRKVFEEIYKTLGSYGLEVRTITSKEEFATSPEARSQLNKMSNISNKNHAKVMLDITNNLFELSDRLSNIDIVYLIIRTRSNYQKFDIEDVIRKIKSLLKEYRTSFRTVEFLYKNSLLDLYKDFYGLEAIDLSLMKIKGKDLEDITKQFIEVYQLIDSEGRVFTNKEALEKKIEVARKINL